MYSLILFLSATLLGGCHFHENSACNSRNAGECELEQLEGGLSGTQDTATEAPAPVFTLSPDEATAGETFIAALTADNFDLSTVGSIEVFGNASVVATQNRGDELILTVTVSAEAQPGDVVDLLLNVGNDAVFIEAALSVVDPADVGETDDNGDVDGDTDGEDNGDEGGEDDEPCP